MIIKNAWFLEACPNEIVIEKEDGLFFAKMTPYRKIKESELRDYKGYHPRKCKGQPLPNYLYRHYGIEKSNETASEVLRVRVTPTEKQKIQADADATDMSLSDYIRTKLNG